jgi:hypothetical protein
MKSFTPVMIAASLALPSVNAAVAAIVNRCPSSVYIWSVGDEQDPMVALPNQTIGYSEEYRTKEDGGGISIKFAPWYAGDHQLDFSRNISQFEYTLDHESNKIWYDLSNVNGNAYQEVPILLQPSDTSCPNVTCAADDAVCKAAYNNWNDDLATHACGIENDLILTLCTNQTESAASTSTPGTTSDGGAVTVGANGDLQVAPSTNTGNSEFSTSTSGGDDDDDDNWSSFSQLNKTGVVDWINPPSTPSKRDAVPSSLSHSLEHFKRIRRSRIFRHSH